MGKLTREKAIEKHRELWNEIAHVLSEIETGDIELWDLKTKALRNLGEKEIPLNGCYCCEYTKPYDYEGACDFCPIKWRCRGEFRCEKSEFGDFKNELYFREYDSAREIALTIANLPKNTEV